jgi:hypothetical protein
VYILGKNGWLRHDRQPTPLEAYNLSINICHTNKPTTAFGYDFIGLSQSRQLSSLRLDPLQTIDSEKPVLGFCY